MSRRLSQVRLREIKKSIQIKRILDFSISVGDETSGENIRGYELFISPKRRGITHVCSGYEDFCFCFCTFLRKGHACCIFRSFYYMLSSYFCHVLSSNIYSFFFIQLGFQSSCFDVSVILFSLFFICVNFSLFLPRFWMLSIFSVSGVLVINSVCLLVSPALCPACIDFSRVKFASRSILSLGALSTN